MLLTLRKNKENRLISLGKFSMHWAVSLHNVCVELLSTSLVVPRNETNGVTGPNEGMRVEPSWWEYCPSTMKPTLSFSLGSNRREIVLLPSKVGTPHKPRHETLTWNPHDQHLGSILPRLQSFKGEIPAFQPSNLLYLVINNEIEYYKRNTSLASRILGFMQHRMKTVS